MRRNWLVSLLIVGAFLGLIGGLSGGALWEPHEVSAAELSRRIGLNLLGGASLALPEADNSLPIRADLGRGELPFTSAALGLRLFGLSEWAARLPLLLWSLAGAAVMYAALARLWHRRAALYAALVLMTTPLFYLQARTLLGDAVTVACFVIAWSGLAVAVLAPEQSRRARLGFALLGALGLYAGFWCRGPIASVAVPAGAIGVTALFTKPASKLARGLGWAASSVAALGLTLGVLGLSLARATGEYSVFVGSALAAPAELPSFQTSLAALAHACFPWSAAAPLALALPWRGLREEALDPRAAISLAATLGLAASLAASAWLAPTLGPSVLPGAACFAILLGLALSELEDERLGSPVLGVATAALAVMLGADLSTYPEKVLAGFGLAGVSLPESLEPLSAKLWLGAGLLLALGSTLCLLERDPERERLPAFVRTEYEALVASLQRVWDGNLVFALLVVEAGLVGFLLLTAISERIVPLPQLEGVGVFSRKLVALSAIAVPVCVLVPLATMLLRDLARVGFGRPWPGPLRLLSPTRAQGMLCLGGALGLVASLGFYPALARQLAPKAIFDRYHELARSGEPLGLLGDEGVAARYQGSARAKRLVGADAAFDWLRAGGDAAPRRWLLLRKAELAPLNALFRSGYARNLPILDARSSEVFLASNRLARGERDENPLAPLVLDALPELDHPLQAVLGEELEVLGWSLRSPSGAREDSLTPATRYRLVIYYRVLRKLSGSWKTFVHLDGFQRRFNADHELLDGKYPLELWRPGDVIADATDVLLEPNFSQGDYRLYFGLYAGSRRLTVSRGPAQDDRIVAGTLQVR